MSTQRNNSDSLPHRLSIAFACVGLTTAIVALIGWALEISNSHFAGTVWPIIHGAEYGSLSGARRYGSLPFPTTLKKPLHGDYR